MVLNLLCRPILEMLFPPRSNPKPGEILIFRTFLAKFSILAYISLKIGYFELGHDYDEIIKFFVPNGFWYERFLFRMVFIRNGVWSERF